MRTRSPALRWLRPVRTGVQHRLAGQDVVIDATRSGMGLRSAGEDFHPRAAEALVAALRALGAGAPRRFVVGGAGSLEVAPGQRTGRFRLGGDALLKDAAGESRISMEDYAVALPDEIEHPAHLRQRFTVGY